MNVPNQILYFDLVSEKLGDNMATFMTNDEWAIKKDFADMVAYTVANPYPSATTLDSFREDAHGNILTEARGTPNLDAKFLRNLEYRMVELMIDEEQGRATEDGRPMYVPRDYMFTRDRAKISGSGSSGFTRGIGS